MEKNSIRELYQGIFKISTPMVIDGKNYLEDDTLLFFNNIQEITFGEDILQKESRGGWNNRSLVNWTMTKEVSASLNVGVINNLTYGLLNSNKIKSFETKSISQIENKEVINKRIKCNHPIDITKSISLYKIINGTTEDKILDYSIENDTIILDRDISNNVLVDYWYNYTDSGKYIEIGNRDLNGYLKFTGKFYYVDEFSGVRKTGLLEIPRLRINGSFNIRLGRNISPIISNLNFQAIPVGDRESSYAIKISYLNEDIDSEI
jgi:hypothetical protein